MFLPKILRDNLFSLVALQAINMALPIIVLPFIVRVVGVDVFGQLIFSQSIFLLLSLLVGYGFDLYLPKTISSMNL